VEIQVDKVPVMVEIGAFLVANWFRIDELSLRKKRKKRYNIKK